MSTPEQAPPPVADEPLAGIDDANDLRGAHFKRLMRKPLTWILVGAPALIAGIVLAAIGIPAIGGAAFVVLLLLGVVIVFLIADSRAADDFFAVYAEQRGMSMVRDRGQLPERTPLLSKGDDRYTERTLLGPLGEGFDGTLALYTYEEEHTDSEGRRQTSYYRFTVGLLELPECADHLPELYCQQKFGFRALEGLEDVFRTKKERVKLESEALLDKYEIFASTEQDAIWLRRLFAPSFIVWMTDAAPKKFGFELVDGTLCCYVNGHKDSAEDLDEMLAASVAVAKRLRDEVAETNLERETGPTA